MIGTSPFAKQISRQTRKFADKKDILIIGEHGSGKRHLAHEIHQKRTKRGPYILLGELGVLPGCRRRGRCYKNLLN